MALARYVVGSFVVAGGLVYHAMSTREQYFPAMLYLSSSKLSVVVLGNLAFALTLCLGHLLKAIFLGRLREAEVERLYERAKDAIMETCLAMTIFREEFNVKFVVLFVSLLFVKIFHWLCGDRVEHVETAPATSRLTHVRVCSLMFLLFALDVSFLRYAVAHTLKIGPSVLLLFGFEYVILASKAVATFAKYCIVALDNFLDGRWEGKGTAVFYLELVTDLLHLFVYFVFFLIIFAYYGLPVHLVRDLYLTFRNFRRRVGEFLRYRKVTANLDERFPDCTREELQEGDDVCIICRDEMACGAAGGARPKKLPCGHCFHLGCLRSWLERQQACPTCRAAVVPAEDAHAANGENEAGGGGNPDAAEDAAMRAAFRRELFGEGGGGAAGEGGTPAAAATAADANANANPAAPPPRVPPPPPPPIDAAGARAVPPPPPPRAEAPAEPSASDSPSPPTADPRSAPAAADPGSSAAARRAAAMDAAMRRAAAARAASAAGREEVDRAGRLPSDSTPSAAAAAAPPSPAPDSTRAFDSDADAARQSHSSPGGVGGASGGEPPPSFRAAAPEWASPWTSLAATAVGDPAAADAGALSPAQAHQIAAATAAAVAAASARAQMAFFQMAPLGLLAPPGNALAGSPLFGAPPSPGAAADPTFDIAFAAAARAAAAARSGEAAAAAAFGDAGTPGAYDSNVHARGGVEGEEAARAEADLGGDAAAARLVAARDATAKARTRMHLAALEEQVARLQVQLAEARREADEEDEPMKGKGKGPEGHGEDAGPSEK